MRRQPITLLDHQAGTQGKVTFGAHKFLVDPDVTNKQHRRESDHDEEGAMFF